MVGKSGYTMQTERLNLGRSPNININAKETTINNWGGYGSMGIDTPIFPYGQSYNNGMYPGSYNPGLSKAEKWLLGTGVVTSFTGALLSAFTGKKESVADTPEIQNPEIRAQLQQQQQQMAEINRKLEAARRENAELKEASQLYQEGITKNDDGTYSKTIKGADGNNVTITGKTPAEVRSKASAAEGDNAEALQLQEEGITKNED